jgi:hypothetical protein
MSVNMNDLQNYAEVCYDFNLNYSTVTDLARFLG